MSWSLTTRPSFFPGFPTWSDFERDVDRDFSRIHRLFSDVAQQVRPDNQGVHHRTPSYTYNEDHNNAHIEIELPGVAKENVNISLHADNLEISAKRFKNVQVDMGAEQNVGNGGKSSPQKMQTQVPQDDAVKKDTDDSVAQEAAPSVMYKLNVPIGNKFDLDKTGATMLGDGILSLVVPKKVEHTAASRAIEIGSA